MPKCQKCRGSFPIAQLRKERVVYGGGAKDVLMCTECRGAEPAEDEDQEEAPVVALYGDGPSQSPKNDLLNRIVDVKGDERGLQIIISSELIQVTISVAWSAMKEALTQKLRELGG